MTMVAITPNENEIAIALVYATPNNFTGRPVYRRAAAFLHSDAAAALYRAAAFAKSIGYTLLIYDAFRPTEAQWILWNHTPDPNFLADPRKGSPHSRGVAVDLTLRDASGEILDMGTGFDEFTPRSFHGDTEISPTAQRNRHLLLGLMTAAGWDFYRNEWWHYQLFDAKRYPLVSDDDIEPGMMRE